MTDVMHLNDPHFRYSHGVGYTLEIYARGGTVDPISSWADADQVGLNPWPVVLDSVEDGTEDGVAFIYLDRDATLLLKTVAGDVVGGVWNERHGEPTRLPREIAHTRPASARRRPQPMRRALRASANRFRRDRC